MKPGPDNDINNTVPGLNTPNHDAAQSNGQNRHSPVDRGQQTLVGTPAGPVRSATYRFLSQPEQEDEIGRLGNYRVLRLLGRGGMAFVFLAEDLTLRRRVALKVMKPDLDQDPSAWQRFLREAQILASIKHDHLVTVFQVGHTDDCIYLAMEWLQGETLDSWVVRRGPARTADILRLAREMATGLDVIHGRGLIHRDIKPGNIWLEEPGQRIKLLDFGLARRIDDDAQFTQSGNIVGTPAFMSPEQARGDRIDARSDLFSLGGVLYFLCTGTLPFNASTTMGILTALATSEPRPIEEMNPDLPPALTGLVMRLLAKDADARPVNAKAVGEQIRRIENGLNRDSGTEWDFPVSAGPTYNPVATKRRKRARFQSRAMKVTLVISLLLVLLIGTGIALNAALVKSESPATPTNPVPQQQVAKKDPTPIRPAVATPSKAFLSELKPIDVKDWHKTVPMPKGGPDQRMPPPPEIEGVVVAGVRSPHGLFMHPPPQREGGTTSVGFRLNKQYDSFQTRVSLNDGPPESETPLTFVVYGDDRLLWKSRPVRSQADTQTCNVSVKDVSVLTIEVECPGRPHGAHAVWIEPVVSSK